MDVVSDLEILLIPCNQFSSSCELSDVIAFSDQENIDFAQVFAPVDINGTESHPLFAFLKSERPGVIAWNFSKFLVGKSGNEVERFNHRILFSAIENEIQKMM
jgi:glutathione peroxidase